MRDPVTAPEALCVCGHERQAHDHYRAGSECTFCGAAGCPRFRRRTWWRRLLG
ncbi:hypothetical protein [Symbioplanes lichenis]|uniref:hypothetical protein n=1 Tax=Symbioplanes lichenis TaxID=1629072 RepID=UPI002739C362|nr:hypothetical protein [Actinoplanes lichenis]